MNGIALSNTSTRRGWYDIKRIKKTLVLMAAGFGSRFGGGVKQLESVRSPISPPLWSVIIETAKANGLDVLKYQRFLFQRGSTAGDHLIDVFYKATNALEQCC